MGVPLHPLAGGTKRGDHAHVHQAITSAFTDPARPIRIVTFNPV
jgi:hypothetical protein